VPAVVTIAWEDTPTHWALRVSDNGRGALCPQGPPSGPLGLRLVRMLARQLRGTVHVESSEDGFSVAVEVARS
jgi:two-component sensor histidine kinase